MPVTKRAGAHGLIGATMNTSGSAW
jgi:hypothetical protein